MAMLIAKTRKNNSLARKVCMIGYWTSIDASQGFLGNIYLKLIFFKQMFLNITLKFYFGNVKLDFVTKCPKPNFRTNVFRTSPSCQVFFSFLGPCHTQD